MFSQFDILRCNARCKLLQMHYESKVGHIGGNLSAIDILLYLYHHYMAPEDVFLLSKGHAAGALYVALWSKGWLSDADLSTFHRDATRLAGHPPAQGIAQIPFATGSLGHGLSLAAGLALGYRLRGDSRQVFCLLSDGEMQEGSTLEALGFAAHHRLSNLIILLDGNGLQGFGSTQDIASQDAQRFLHLCAAYGIACTIADGHDPISLTAALLAPSPSQGPRAVWCNTVKGRGVPFMENRMEWHYLPMSEDQYRHARSAVEAGRTA